MVHWEQSAEQVFIKTFSFCFAGPRHSGNIPFGITEEDIFIAYVM